MIASVKQQLQKRLDDGLTVAYVPVHLLQLHEWVLTIYCIFWTFIFLGLLKLNIGYIPKDFRDTTGYNSPTMWVV